MRMLPLAAWLALCLTRVVCESIKVPINPTRLEFDLWPYKKWEIDNASNSSDYMTCFEMSTPFKSRDLQFDKNLVRSRHGLENGETILYESVYEQQEFQFCLINFSLDSSWNAIDTIKQVSISISSNDIVKQQPWDLITDQSLELLSESKEDLYSLVNAESGHKLVELDAEHRDLNEGTFSCIIYQTVGIITVIIVGQFVVVPAFLYRLMRKNKRGQTHPHIKNKLKE
ncbi:hypothetical protein C6P41_003765 [Kluyveromyces marxianus]|nr:hypothetical protein C6P41_003765 [Kluyveromyces marxianus]